MLYSNGQNASPLAVRTETVSAHFYALVYLEGFQGTLNLLVQASGGSSSYSQLLPLNYAAATTDLLQVDLGNFDPLGGSLVCQIYTSGSPSGNATAFVRSEPNFQLPLSVPR
jgi:hypothetical protein